MAHDGNPDCDDVILIQRFGVMVQDAGDSELLKEASGSLQLLT